MHIFIVEINLRISNHEGEVHILNSIPVIEIAENLSVGSMERQEARPHSAAQDSESLRGVTHHGPPTVRLSNCDIVQKVRLEDISLALAHRPFVLLCRCSEVHI